MRLRNDAVAGAAEWVVGVERLALDTPGLVATVGDLRTYPGAGNIVAGQLRASLDVRHADDAVRRQAVETFLAGDVCLAEDRTGEGHSGRFRGVVHVVIMVIETEHLW